MYIVNGQTELGNVGVSRFLNSKPTSVIKFVVVTVWLKFIFVTKVWSPSKFENFPRDHKCDTR